MSENYIKNKFKKNKACNVIEQRMNDTSCTIDLVLEKNSYNLKMWKTQNCTYTLIDATYTIETILDKIKF